MPQSKSKRTPTTKKQQEEIVDWAPQVEEVKSAPTAAKAWVGGRKSGFNVRLPSGNVARIRRTMDIFDLVQSGRLPNKLTGVISELIDKAQGKKDETELSKLATNMLGDDEETLLQLLGLIDFIVSKMMVEPPCVTPPERLKDEPLSAYEARISGWAPPEGCISTLDLDTDDKSFLFGIAQGGSTALEPFRAQQAAALDATQDGGKVQPKTKRVSKPKGN